MKYLNLTLIIFALLFTSCSDNDNDSSPKAELNGFWNGVAYSEVNNDYYTYVDTTDSEYIESLAAFEIGWDNGTLKPIVPAPSEALRDLFDNCEICTLSFDNSTGYYASSVFALSNGTYEVDGNIITLYHNDPDFGMEMEGTFQITNTTNTQNLYLELHGYDFYEFDYQEDGVTYIGVQIYAYGWKYSFSRNI